MLQGKSQKLNLKMLKLKKLRKYLGKFSWIDAKKALQRMEASMRYILAIPVRYLSISSPFRFWNRKFSILSVSFWYWYWNEHLWGIDIGIGFETASAGFWYWYWFWNSFCWVLVLVLVLKLASAGFWYWYWFWIWFYVSVLISKNDSWSLVWYWIYVALKRHCRTHKMRRPFSCTTCDYVLISCT